MKVVRTKAFTSIEKPEVDTSVATEIDWEIQSLRELLQVSNLRLISCGDAEVKGIQGKSVAIQGTTAKASLAIDGNVDGATEYRVKVMSGVPVKGTASVRCGGKELHVEVVMAIGEDHKVICAIEVGAELHAAMRSCANVRILLRLQPIPTTRRVDTVIQESLDPDATAVGLAASFRDALTAGQLQEFADVELLCNDKESFHAHRQLLAIRSPVFRATFYCGMRETHTKQARIEASGAAVKELLHFIYTGELLEEGLEAAVAEELLGLGEQYLLPSLVTLVERHLLHSLSISNVAERLQLSVRHGTCGLRDACIGTIKRNFAAVMATDGWSCIAKDSSVMGLLIRERSDLSTTSMTLAQPSRKKPRLA